MACGKKRKETQIWGCWLKQLGELWCQLLRQKVNGRNKFPRGLGGGYITVILEIPEKERETNNQNIKEILTFQGTVEEKEIKHLEKLFLRRQRRR